MYQGFDFSSLNGGAANLSFSDLASLAGRTCGRLSRLWEIEKASPSDAPRTVSVWASPISSTNFSASRPPVFHPPIAPFRLSRIFGTGGEIGLGASVQLSARASLFGSVENSSTFGGDTHSYGEKVGLRVNW
ncbi:autotransporter outer membrane beta-barrel domain-containing protein [Rhizobium sp. 2YAF20]|uniref:autotransporter outer membrane beta-barrel domain-containing protein n=1 Tax=Rhizobium sp. 2YAF20 TaxID=3233027 RepID=UPI003F9A0DF7